MSTIPPTQLLCSIEKAVWFTITDLFIPALFFFSETKQDFFKCVSAKILVSLRAFIHSFVKVTSPNSFILFRPLSWKKAHFRGVPGGPNWATPVQNMPLGPLLMVKKKNLHGKLNWMFPIYIKLALSVPCCWPWRSSVTSPLELSLELSSPT